MARNTNTWMNRMLMKYKLGNGGSRCPMCGKLLGSDGFDLHEALFTRGDLAGVGWQSEIFHPFNCVGVCHEDCHTRATSQGGQVDCALALIEMYDHNDIIEWVNSLPFKSPTSKIVALSVLSEAMYG